MKCFSIFYLPRWRCHLQGALKKYIRTLHVSERVEEDGGKWTFGKRWRVGESTIIYFTSVWTQMIGRKRSTNTKSFFILYLVSCIFGIVGPPTFSIIMHTIRWLDVMIPSDYYSSIRHIFSFIFNYFFSSKIGSKMDQDQKFLVSDTSENVGNTSENVGNCWKLLEIVGNCRKM